MMRASEWYAVLVGSVLLLIMGATAHSSLGQAVASTSVAQPDVTLSKQVDRVWVHPGDLVTYTVILTNSGDLPATDVVFTDTLPAGFAYVPGSSRLSMGSILIPWPEPTVQGNQVTWAALTVPESRGHSFYGINTFVQERCQPDYIDWQLDRARELAGPGAWVKQLFYGITPNSRQAPACWVHFVNAAYDRDLKPVLRLQGVHGGSYWLKPPTDPSGGFGDIAQAYGRVVASLPRRDGHKLFIQIWNEPNLDLEWGGAASPPEYGRFLAATADALRALGDDRIVLLNGPLSPGGNIEPLAFIDQMLAGDGDSLWAFDLWGVHPYPGNHPPEYNIHDNTAAVRQATIDSYLPQLERLAQWGRPYLKVLLSETGYELWNNSFGWEGYPPIDENNRAHYSATAFSGYWQAWPEVVGVMPFQLVDPLGNWELWDWLYRDGTHHPHYDAVRDLDKSNPFTPTVVTVSFQARAALTPGTYTNRVEARASDAAIQPSFDGAPVTVGDGSASPHAVWLPIVLAPRNGNQAALDGLSDLERKTEAALVISLAYDEVRGRLAAVGEGQLMYRSLDARRWQSGGAIDGIPQGIQFSPDGETLYVAMRNPGHVLAVDLSLGQAVAAQHALAAPAGVAWLGAQLWVADTERHEIVGLDPTTLAIRQRISLPGAPFALVTNPGGRGLLAGLADTGQVAWIDPSRNELVRLTRLPGLGISQSMAVDPIRDRVYIASLLAPQYGQITILNDQAEIVETLTPHLNRPLAGVAALAVAPLRDQLYITSREGIEVFSLADLQYAGRLTVTGPAWPFGLALDESHDKLYVTGPAVHWQEARLLPPSQDIQGFWP